MVIIAQQQPDGVIRYVSVPKFYNYDLPHILRNFYPKETRVSALIDLGNLVTLRPTPFGKPRDYYDKVYCRARIRDDKEKKGRHQPRYADSEEALMKLEPEGFLFKEGQWHHFKSGTLSASLPESLDSPKTGCMSGLEVTRMSADGQLHTIPESEISNWGMLVSKAKEKNEPYFIFRNKRLVTTINHPLNRL